MARTRLFSRSTGAALLICVRFVNPGDARTISAVERPGTCAGSRAMVLGTSSTNTSSTRTSRLHSAASKKTPPCLRALSLRGGGEGERNVGGGQQALPTGGRGCTDKEATNGGCYKSSSTSISSSTSETGFVERLAGIRAGGWKETEVRENHRVSARWPMFSAFLYFLAMAFVIPVLPKMVNEMVTGSKMVTAASATLYAVLASTDSFFTLLSVNFHATLSDKYGRRPFMALSALGLGTGFFITYHSRKVWMLVMAAVIDGCTSCMYSIAQACITDCVGTGPGLSEALGLFQGLSLGMAFMIGLPLGGVLGAKYGFRFPLLVSVSLCVLNFVLVAFVMPETLKEENRREGKINLKQANPLGAVKLALRNKLITGVIACWTLMWVAHIGLQITWINYTDQKFQWGVAQSGASLAMMGLLVAVFPKLIIPRLGLERSITYGLLIYAFSQLVIALAPEVTHAYGSFGTPMAVTGLVLASAGTVVFPSTLAFLSNQVGKEEVGALQGTADTAKTVCSVVFGPAMAWIFGYYAGEDAYPRKIDGANFYVGMMVVFIAWFAARHTFSNHGELDRVPPSERVTIITIIDH